MKMIFAGTLLFLLFGCGKGNQVPEGVLPREKMEAVLWDMIQADEFLKDFVLNKDTTLNDTLEMITMYERVFRFHQLDRQTFDSSFNFYRTHPKLMKEVLDSLQVHKQGVAPSTVPFDRPVTLPVDTADVFPRIKKALRPG
jgi:hypothetical protein